MYVKARTARVARRCDNDRTPIRLGDRYLRHVAFPGDDILQPDRPIALVECVRCAVTGGREFETGACLSFCHGVEPCALPFKHDGDHRCHQCPESAPTGEAPAA